MAYVTEEIINKARIALKALNKEYGIKATLSGKNGSQLCLTIAEGSIDFIGNYCNVISYHNTLRNVDGVRTEVLLSGSISVNHYYLDTAFDGKALEYLEKAKAIMLVDHWDKSDIMTDYFNCSYYISMRVGRWNKAYKFQK